METLRHVVLFIHLIGFAVLFGSWAAQAFGGKRQVTSLMQTGMVIALIAGLALAAPWGLGDREMNMTKIAVKLVVLIAIAAFLGIGQSRGKKTGVVPPVLFWGIGVLTLANAGIAAIW